MRIRPLFRSTRVVSILAVATSLLLSASTAAAKKEPVLPKPQPFYRPKLLASVADAAEKIQFLAPHIQYGSYHGAARTAVNRTGVQFFFHTSGVTQRTQYFWSWTGGYNAPVTTPYEYNASLTLLYSAINSLRYADGMVYICTSGNDCETLTTPTLQEDLMLMDALLTLAVGGGNAQVAALDMAWDGVPPKELKKLKLADGRRVTMVHVGGPAEAAGIRVGDILAGMEGEPYHSNIYGQAAARCLQAHPEGGTIEVELRREGVPMKVAVVVTPAVSRMAAVALQAQTAVMAARMADAAHSAPAPPQPAPGGAKLGVGVRDLTDEEAKAAGLDPPRGVLVMNVEPGSMADGMKVRAGDILLEVNGTRVETCDGLKRLLSGGRVEALTVWRAGASVKLQAVESL